MKRSKNKSQRFALIISPCIMNSLVTFPKRRLKDLTSGERNWFKDSNEVLCIRSRLHAKAESDYSGSKSWQFATDFFRGHSGCLPVIQITAMRTIRNVFFPNEDSHCVEQKDLSIAPAYCSITNSLSCGRTASYIRRRDANAF